MIELCKIKFKANQVFCLVQVGSTRAHRFRRRRRCILQCSSEHYWTPWRGWPYYVHLFSPTKYNALAGDNDDDDDDGDYTQKQDARETPLGMLSFNFCVPLFGNYKWFKCPWMMEKRGMNKNSGDLLERKSETFFWSLLKLFHITP